MYYNKEKMEEGSAINGREYHIKSRNESIC